MSLSGTAWLAIDRRSGRRLIVHPTGLALPGKTGRHHYAIIPSDLFYAAIDAGSGRNAAYGPLLVQRLLREQAKRGAAQVSPAVLAADLGIKLKLALALLDSLERACVVERHRSHPLDSDEFHVYTVPGGDALYGLDADRLDEEQTRVLETVELGEHRLTVLGRRIDLDALDHRIVAVRAELAEEEIERIVGGLVAGNLTGATVLAGDLLNGLRPTLTVDSPDANPSLGPTPEAAWPDTSIGSVGTVGPVDMTRPSGTDAASRVTKSGIGETLEATLDRLDAEWMAQHPREQPGGEDPPAEGASVEPAVLDVSGLSPEEYRQLVAERSR